MDWTLAIRRNRAALLAVVAAIVALLGGRDASPGPIARRLRNAALALLRPAEAAARRLIVVAARGLTVAPRRPSVFPPALAGRAPEHPSRPPAFRLFDRRKRYALRLPVVKPAGVPRIRAFWAAAAPAPLPPPVPLRPGPEAFVDVSRLRLRLAALERALGDLPRQARRLARWRARAQVMGSAAGGIPSPLRFGRPPGWRLRPGGEVDLVLRECHALALDALALDTS